jgi:hypothetical protein
VSDTVTDERASASIGLVAAVSVAVATVRWWVAHERVVFHLTPDEPGQLAIARFLGGGTVWHMFDHSTRNPGYAALISPVHWFTDDPATIMRSALAVNALLGGVAVALLCVLAHRLTDLSPRWCVAAAALVSLLPGVLFVTDFAWAESLVTVTFLGTLVALLRFVDAPSFARGTVAVLVAGAAHATHDRMVPLVVVTTVVAWVLVARHRLAAVAAMGLTVGAAGLTVAVNRFDAFVVGRVWDDATGTNSADAVGGQLTKFSDLPIAATGQIWYLLVTTAGVIGLGALGLARSSIGGRNRALPTRADAVVVLGTVAPLVALSIVFMADRWRPDQIVYGRYNDAVTGPIVLVGLASLVRVRAVGTLLIDAATVAAITVAAALVLVALKGDELRETVTRAMVLGFQAVTGADATVPVVLVTSVSLVVGAALVVAAIAGRDHRSVPLLVTVVLVLTWAGVRTRDVVDMSLNAWQRSGAVASLRDGPLQPGQAVRFRQVPTSERPSASWSDQRQRRMLYQFYLPHTPMYLDGDPRTDALTPYVFAPLRDPELSASGAELLWRDPSVSIGLWREP